jgi:hypothetical protein
MLSQEFQFKQDYSALIAAFNAAFPDITPPEAAWFFHWLAKYPAWAIKDAIQVLEQHPMKGRFTTASTGKAISALLRTDALKRAITSAQPTHGGAK